MKKPETVTKRELNQQTARVLDRVREKGVVLVTERGVPRWRIEPVNADADPLERLRAQGRIIPARENPMPWPDEAPYTGDRTPADVDALYAWERGDH